VRRKASVIGSVDRAGAVARALLHVRWMVLGRDLLYLPTESRAMTMQTSSLREHAGVSLALGVLVVILGGVAVPERMLRPSTLLATFAFTAGVSWVLLALKDRLVRSTEGARRVLMHAVFGALWGVYGSVGTVAILAAGNLLMGILEERRSSDAGRADSRP
jgi:hypothetical protein